MERRAGSRWRRDYYCREFSEWSKMFVLLRTIVPERHKP